MTTVHAQTGIKLATKPAKTSLLGGHFIYKVNNTPDAPTPSSANVVEWVDNDPTLWRHNVHIGSSGIKLRYGETTLSKWDTSSLIFYKPRTEDGSTVIDKGIELSKTNGLVLYKTTFDTSNLTAQVKDSTITHVDVGVNSTTFLSKINTVGEHRFVYSQTDNGYLYNEEVISRSVLLDEYGISLWTSYDEGPLGPFDGEYIVIKVFIPAVVEKGIQLTSTGLEIFGSSQNTADVTVTSNGINIGKGKITGGTVGSTSDHFIYLSTEDYGTGLVINSSAEKTDWRLIVGGQFGVDHYGRMWALGAHISGEIKATTGTIGGWTLGLNSLYKGYIGDNNSAFLASSNLSGTVAGKTFTSSDAATTGWRLTAGSNFGVDNTGKLYAANANITGEVNATSGYIGTATDGFIIDSYGFYVGTKTSNTTNSIALSRQLFTRTIDGTSRSDLCFAIGSKFAVDKDGNLYANGANITNINVGTITISDVSGLQNSLTYAQNNADYYFDDIANGVAVHNYTNTTQPDNRIEITSTGGLEIFKGGLSVAQYSTTARIGQIANGKSRIEIKDTGIDFYNRTYNTDVSLAHIGFNTGQDEQGTTTEDDFPYYTFGKRTNDTSATRGNYSFAEGTGVEAEGYASHAEGWWTTARGSCSHAEGKNTMVTGPYAHAEGLGTYALAAYTHTQNYQTLAQWEYQTAIGSFNKNKSINLFEIGNGSTSRSNAFEVDWDGNITVANHSSHIGDVKSHAPSDVSCSDRKYYQLAYLTLDPGVWLIDACARFPATNATGVRQVRISTATSGYNNVSDAPSAIGNIAIDSRGAVNAALFPSVHFPVKVTSTTTYRVIGYQSSGSNVSASGRIYATRIQ